MKLRIVTIVTAFITFILICSAFRKNRVEPWKEQQLMPPTELAQRISSGKMSSTYILNIGPSGSIRNSITIGATQEASGLASLKKELSRIPKNSEVIIYCGCCPFEHCPNIRPAFELLIEMKFTNAKLLNMPKNLKVDWIDKGYPMQ